MKREFSTQNLPLEKIHYQLNISGVKTKPWNHQFCFGHRKIKKKNQTQTETETASETNNLKLPNPQIQQTETNSGP
jgi:hypothetical protein